MNLMRWARSCTAHWRLRACHEYSCRGAVGERFDWLAAVNRQSAKCTRFHMDRQRSVLFLKGTVLYRRTPRSVVSVSTAVVA